MKRKHLLTIAALTATSMAAVAQTMSPDTELLLLHHQTATQATDARAIKALGASATPTEIDAFIRVSGPETVDMLRAAGVTVNSEVDDIVTVTLPLDKLPVVAKITGVERIEAGHPVELRNNSTRNHVWANAVMFANSPQHEADMPGTFRGNGVVVGMIDSGFEYNHKAFRSYDGQDRLRVAKVWNQNSVGIPPSGYTYGAEYASPETIRAAAYDTAGQFHGTHTSTTAAGSDSDSPYYGMAPESDLVLVSADLASDTHIIDAIKYIFDYAESVGKPCVINLSLGSHVGPHDGTSAIDQAMSSLAGPGRILVGAVGNEADVNIHASKTFTAGDTDMKTMIAYTNGSTKHSMIYMRGTPGKKFTVEVALVDPTRRGRIVKSSGEIAPGDQAKYFYLEEGETTDIFVSTSSIVADGDLAPQMTIESNVSTLASNRKQAIIVHGEEGGEIHLWHASTDHYFVDGNITGFTKGDNACTVGEIGGTSDGIISVGSFDGDSIIYLSSTAALPIHQVMTDMGWSFESGATSCFSSRGPTADGRMKPEVLAPGCWVISGFNKYASALKQIADNIPSTTDAAGNRYYYEISVGTSMSAPAVTGVVAEWLEADPTLSPDDIRGILSRTCNRDKFTGDTPNNTAGYGKINAYRGIRDILQLTSAIDDVVAEDTEMRLWIEPDTRTIVCVAPGSADVNAFTVSGAKVASCRIDPDNRTIDASSWAPGIYIINVAARGCSQSFKVMVR